MRESSLYIGLMVLVVLLAIIATVVYHHHRKRAAAKSSSQGLSSIPPGSSSSTGISGFGMGPDVFFPDQDDQAYRYEQYIKPVFISPILKQDFAYTLDEPGDPLANLPEE